VVEAERDVLATELVLARASLASAEGRERHVRGIAHVRTARLLRLASQLTVQLRRTDSLRSELEAGREPAVLAPAETPPACSEPDEEQAEERSGPSLAPLVLEAPSPEPELAEAQGTEPGVASVVASGSPTSRDDLRARLARMAAGNPDVRAKLLDRVQAAAKGPFCQPSLVLQVPEPEPEEEDEEEEAALPVGWSAHVDAASECVYYFNSETAESQWERPTVTVCQTSTPPAAARLAQLAASDSSLREAMKARLRAIEVSEPAVPLGTHEGERESCDSASVSSPARMAAQITDMAAEYGASRAREEVLGAELRAERLVASAAAVERGCERKERDELRAAAVGHAQELGRCKAERDALGLRVAEATEAAESAKATAREVAREAEDRRGVNAKAAGCSVGASVCGPALRLHWADVQSTSWPGASGPDIGTKHLRRSLQGRDASLHVCPPPADWRTCVQMGLRRGMPANPAYLRLETEDSTFLGLLWAADNAATVVA
jgi:hypothetical protein